MSYHLLQTIRDHQRPANDRKMIVTTIVQQRATDPLEEFQRVKSLKLEREQLKRGKPQWPPQLLRRKCRPRKCARAGAPLVCVLYLGFRILVDGRPQVM